MTPQAIAKWVDDGFLHPSSTVMREFVDVDDFLRIPVDGLSEVIQFARVRVDDVAVIVVGPNSGKFRSLLETVFRGRHPDARQVFLSSASSGLVIALGEDLADVDAVAIAVTQLRFAWDESAHIRVQDDLHVYLVDVAFQNDSYVVSARISPT